MVGLSIEAVQQLASHLSASKDNSGELCMAQEADQKLMIRPTWFCKTHSYAMSSISISRLRKDTGEVSSQKRTSYLVI